MSSFGAAAKTSGPTGGGCSGSRSHCANASRPVCRTSPTYDRCSAGRAANHGSSSAARTAALLSGELARCTRCQVASPICALSQVAQPNSVRTRSATASGASSGTKWPTPGSTSTPTSAGAPSSSAGLAIGSPAPTTRRVGTRSGWPR